ncbi:MAG: hypothetical protein IPP64_00380 [Bacteroidetes bacterium]|nr:hypothetical protein [Bacteroidota bacterium]
MKNNLCIAALFILLLGFGCSKKSVTSDSYLHALVDSLAIDKTTNIFIYSINPNDCVNCLYGFSLINKRLSEITNSKIYILAVDREIEKKELIKTSTAINLHDSINKVILWNKNTFHSVGTDANKKNVVGVSLLTIYNYATDSIVYSMPVKEITNAEELMKYTN